MKKIVLISCFFFAFLAVFGQGSAPAWLSENVRALRYPEESFYTGFVYYFVEQGKSQQSIVENAKTEAQADLVKQIRLRVEAKTQSNIYTQNTKGNYSETESFFSEAKTAADAEITGIKTETYYDEKEKKVYALAYVNKYELIGYYKGNLSLNITQIEGLLQTAKDLETNGEKSKARQQLEAAKPLFAKVRYAQDLMNVFDPNMSSDDLQQQKTETLYNQLVQMQARLAQAVYVFVESTEDLFGTSVDIVANKVKAELAINGCSFVDDNEDADFKLRIRVTTRSSDKKDNIVFCYADTAIELFDNHKQKVVFSDEIAQKGGSNSLDKAGRTAMANVAATIVEKLSNWVK